MAESERDLANRPSKVAELKSPSSGTDSNLRPLPFIPTGDVFGPQGNANPFRLHLPPPSSSFYKVIQERSSNRPKLLDTTHVGDVLEALHDYQGSELEALSFEAGDRFVVLSTELVCWWRVRRISDDAIGIVPVNYFLDGENRMVAVDYFAQRTPSPGGQEMVLGKARDKSPSLVGKSPIFNGRIEALPHSTYDSTSPPIIHPADDAIGSRNHSITGGLDLSESRNIPDEVNPAGGTDIPEALDTTHAGDTIEALHDFKASSPEELDFVKGDRFHVLDRVPGHRWRVEREVLGDYRRSVGNVPISYYRKSDDKLVEYFAPRTSLQTKSEIQGDGSSPRASVAVGSTESLVLEEGDVPPYSAVGTGGSQAYASSMHKTDSKPPVLPPDNSSKTENAATGRWPYPTKAPASLSQTLIDYTSSGSEIVAIEGYKGAVPEEMTYFPGDRFIITDRSDAFWHVARIHDGETGLVNPQFFRCPPPIPDALEFAGEDDEIEAFTDGRASDPTDLLFRTGDRAVVLDRSLSLWRVQRVTDGATGLVYPDFFRPSSPRTPIQYAGGEALSTNEPLQVPQASTAPPVYAVSADRDLRLDRLGDELAADSKVWLTYVSTAATHDAEMVDGWNKSLDVLLIFASLFSAVVTAFVIESSKLLQPDYGQVNALLTAHLLNALSNGGNASYLSTLPTPNEILAFEKPISATAVNVLWYAALGFSLASVLVAMLSKQWLAAYASQQQADPHEAARQRQQRFDGLHKWSLPHIMAVLPALLHASLFLFLAGLIIYLWQLDSRVSETTCVILGVLFVFYFASGTLAVFNSNCPYVTPLSQFFRSRLTVTRTTTPPSGDLLIFRAMMWLASSKDPQTVNSALQSLAGLRRGFVGFDAEQVESMAKVALDRLHGCFVPEWRHGGTYCLRTEKLYEACCYARTLMNFVDDSRNHPCAFTAILNEPSLPIFLQLLGSSPNHSVSILALCDYQRLLHRVELARWLSVRGPNGSHDKQQAAKFVRSTPAKENMRRIVELLRKYTKGDIFLQPFAIEIAVEVLGFAPLPWVAAISTNGSSLEPTLLPLLRLLNATREGGIRRALSRTFAIFAEIHKGTRLPDEADDFATRFEIALSITAVIEGGDNSEESARELLLHGLSHFAGNYHQESDALNVNTICEALFHECDKRTGAEDLSFSDKAAVTSLLPLLLTPLEHDQKSEILTRIQANAVSAAPGYNLSKDSLRYRITPRDPFPPETVNVLLKTLDAFKDTTPSWLRDTSILLYLVSREASHKRQLLSKTEVPVVIGLIRDVASEDVANYLFWILTNLAREAVTLSDSDTMLTLASAGILQMLHSYQEKYGLTLADVHLWVDIIPALPFIPPETIKRCDLVDVLYKSLLDSDADQLQRLQAIREPLMQFYGHPLPGYTLESALQVLLTCAENLRNATEDDKEFTYPPQHTILPMDDYD